MARRNLSKDIADINRQNARQNNRTTQNSTRSTTSSGITMNRLARDVEEIKFIQRNGVTPVQSPVTVNDIRSIGDQYNALVNGNVDYNLRPLVTPDDMRKVYRNFSGDVATTYSQGVTDGRYSFELTPITQSGTVLGSRDLNEYIKTLNTTGSLDDLLKSDTEKLIINAREGQWDRNYWDNLEQQLGDIKARHYDAIQRYQSSSGKSLDDIQYELQNYGVPLEQQYNNLKRQLTDLDESIVRMSNSVAPTAQAQTDELLKRRQALEARLKGISGNIYAENKENKLAQYSQDDLDILDQYLRASWDIAGTQGLEYGAADEQMAEQNRLYRELQNRFGSDLRSVLEYRGRDINAEMTEQAKGRWTDMVNQNAGSRLLANAAVRLTNMVSGPAAMIGSVQQYFNPNPYAPLDTNTRANLMQNFGETVTEATSQHILGDNPNVIRRIGNFGYEIGLSMIDSVIAAQLGKALTGTAGLTQDEWLEKASTLGGRLLGMNAAASAMHDVADRGGTKEQAAIVGIAAGIFETFFERFSIENFNRLQQAPVKAFRDVGQNVWKSIVTNGSEELNTELSNIVFDTVFLGDLSNVKIRLNELYETYLEQYGEGKEEDAKHAAYRQLAKELGLQVGMAALGGAVQGAAMGGVGSLVGYVNNRNIERAEKAVQDATDAVEKAIPEGTELSGDAKVLAAAAWRNYQDLHKGTAVTAEQFVNEFAQAYTYGKGGSTLETAKESYTGDLLTDTTFEAAFRAGEASTRAAETAEAASEGAELTTDINAALDEYDIPSAAKNAIQQAYETAGADIDADNYAEDAVAAYNKGLAGTRLSDLTDQTRTGLLPKQLQSIYDIGVSDRVSQQQADTAAARALKAEQIKAGTTGRVVMVSDEDAAKYNVNQFKFNNLSKKQKGAVRAILALSKALHLNVVLYESPVDANGQHIGDNGFFDPSTDTIYIDIASGRAGEQAMIRTMAHELTHHLERYAADSYNELRDFLVDFYSERGSLESLVARQMDIAEQNHRTITEADAVKEVVADACEMMLTDTEAIKQLANEHKTLFQRILDRIDEYLKAIRQAIKNLTPGTPESIELVNVRDTFVQASKLWHQALAESVQQATEEFVEATQELAEPVVTSNGKTLVAELPSHTVVKEGRLEYSTRTWTPDEKDRVRKELVHMDFNREAVDQWINDVTSVAATVLADPNRLDYMVINDAMSMLKTNAEYYFSLDASTLCAKRLLYQGTFDAIQKVLRDVPLMPEDLIDLSNMMRDMGYETPCGICYVESRRRWLDKYAKEWLDTLTGDKPTLDQLTTTDGLENLRKTNFAMYKAFIDAMNAKGSANPKVVQLRTEYKGEIGALTENMIQKVKNIGGLRVQSFSDFEIPHMIDMMQAVMDMASKKLTSQAYTKVPAFAAVFGRTGIKINLSLIGKGRGVDANGNLLFDDVEGMPFAEAMRLRQMYSKNVGTILVGINDEHIIAAMADGRIDFIIPFHKSGWSENELVKMPVLNSYSNYEAYQNELNIVGPKYRIKGYKTQKAVDNWIAKFGKTYPEYTVTKGEHGFTIKYRDGYITESFAKYKERTGKSKENFQPVGINQYWDFGKTGRENAETYLKMCAKDHRMPKFWQFLVDNGDGSFSLPQGNDWRSTAIREGYWKTLIDFKMYDNDGVGSPQQEVVPDFNMVEANRILKEYSLDRKMPSGVTVSRANNNELPIAQDVVDKFVQQYRDNHPEVQRSARVTEAEQELPKLKTLGGSDIQRSRYGVGKQVGNQIYVHKQYADEVIPADVWERAQEIIEENGFQYNTVMYNTKKPNEVRFDEAPRFDTEREPVHGYYVTVNVDDGTVTKPKYDQQIFHHKWMWVHNDYNGFDVMDAYNWSKRWLEDITNPSGYLHKWNDLLRDNGLPVDQDETIQHSMRVVEPIESTSDKWASGHSESWFLQHGFPVREDVSAAWLEARKAKGWTEGKKPLSEKGFEGSQKKVGTQISTTVKTYGAIYDYLENYIRENGIGKDNYRILDASSGLGLGTKLGLERGFNVTDIEPYVSPDSDYMPDYMDYSSLQSHVENGDVEPFDFIISNAVLNVIPQDTRDNMVKWFDSVLADGGTVYVNVLGDSYTKNASTETQYKNGKPMGQTLTQRGVNGAGNEVFVWGSSSVQKGFSNGELKAYLQDGLPGYTVSAPAFKAGSGAVQVAQKPEAAVQRSARATDTEYLRLAEDPEANRERLQAMVDLAARDAGYTVHAYHGTSRADRVGYVFLPERSTSGPMAFFTDSESIAKGYATGKNDTSIAYDDEYRDYHSQFRTKRNGKNIAVGELWKSFPVSKRQAIITAGKHIVMDDDGNPVYDNSAKRGLGNFDEYLLRENKGNAIEALVSSWLDDGNLYGEEGKFLDVLRLAGIDNIEYRDPDARFEKVYNAYLAINKPFDTSMANKGFATALESWYEDQDTGKYDRDGNNADMWDKNNLTFDDWMDRLDSDIENGTTHTWTSIPDFVTDYLRSEGYDGIKDQGGKNGGQGHTVWIPFESSQVKSADPVTYDDNGNVIPLSERFNPADRDIRFSSRTTLPPQAEEVNKLNRRIASMEHQLEQMKHQLTWTKSDAYLEGQIDQGRTMAKEIRRAKAAGEKAVAKAEAAGKRTVASRDREIASLNERIDRLNEVLRETRERRDERLREMSAHYQGRMADMRESRDRQKYRDRVFKRANELLDWVTRPNKNHYVPDILREPVTSLLNAIDLSSHRLLEGGEETKADERLNLKLNALQGVINQMSNNRVDNDGQYDIDPTIQAELDSIVREASAMAAAGMEYTVNTMSADALQNLNHILRDLKHMILRANTLYSTNLYTYINEISDEALQYLQSLGDASQRGRGSLNRFFNWDNALPVFAFDRLGAAGQAIFDGLKNGQAKEAQNLRQVVDFAEETFTGQEAKQWENEKHTIQRNGEDVILSGWQLIELYTTYRRTMDLRRIYGGTGHLFGGGITVTANQWQRNDQGGVLTDEEVQAAISQLTERQIEVADKLQEFISKTGGAWGNQISMARYGKRANNEQYYWPLRSDQNVLYTRAEDMAGKSVNRLLNASFTKPLTPDANNRIYIGSALDTFSAHMSDMAQYNAFALPLLDIVRFMNYRQSEDMGDGRFHVTSIRGALDKAFGVQVSRDGKTTTGLAQGYFRALLDDINGQQGSGRSSGTGEAALSRMKRAAVGANLRVALLQPTAIARASMLINPAYLVRGLGSTSYRADIQEMLEHSGIARWKDDGHYEINASRSIRSMIARDDNVLDKTLEKSMALAGFMDKVTWSVIWRACRSEVQATGQYEKGSQEYFDAITKRFEDIIYRTQVVDSVLTKSQMMRNTSAFDKTFSSFMSEPTTTYNMLASVVQKVSDDNRQYGKAESWRRNSGKVIRALLTFVFSEALVSVAEALMDAWRDDDEFVTYGEKLQKEYPQALIDNLNPLGLLPYASQVNDLIKKAIHFFNPDVYGFDPYSGPLEFANDILDAIGIASNKITGANTKYRNYTTYGLIYKALSGLSTATGIPASAAMREAVTLWNNTVGELYPQYVKRTYDPGTESRIRYAYEDGDLTAEEATELLESRAGLSAEDAVKEVQGWRRKEIRKEQTPDNMDETVQALVEEGGMSERDAYWDVQKQQYEAETGLTFNKYNAVNDAVLYDDNTGYQSAMKELTEHGYTQNDVEKAVRDFLRHAFTGQDITKAESGILGDRTISETEAVRLLTKYGGLDENEALWRIDEWKAEAISGDKSSWRQYDEFYTAVETGKNLKQTINKYLERGIDPKTLATLVTRQFKQQYIDLYNQGKADTLIGYLINAYVLLDTSDDSDKEKRAKAKEKIDNWIKEIQKEESAQEKLNRILGRGA